MTRPIRSDDPRAAEKIAAKIAHHRTFCDYAKAANRLVRAAVKAGAEPDVSQDAPALVALVDGLEALNRDRGLFEDRSRVEIEGDARNLLRPDFAGRRGFPDYELTNRRAEIRRLEARLARLEAASAS